MRRTDNCTHHLLMAFRLSEANTFDFRCYHSHAAYTDRLHPLLSSHFISFHRVSLLSKVVNRTVPLTLSAPFLKPLIA